MNTAKAVELGERFGSPIGRSISLGSFVGNLVSAAIVVAGVIMVFLFIGGGLTIIASAGSGNPQGAEKGKQALTWAIVGFVIVFTSFWIIRIIEIWTNTRFVTYPAFLSVGAPSQP